MINIIKTFMSNYKIIIFISILLILFLYIWKIKNENTEYLLTISSNQLYISELENKNKQLIDENNLLKIDIDNKEIVTKFITIGDLNKLILLSGDMPQNQNECLVEESFLVTNNKKIGDTIKVDIADISNDSGDKIKFLKEDELKIVGTAKSPLFIARDRGTSKLGSGKINYYIYISQDNINVNDIYTSIYLTVKDAEKYETSSDEYEDYIEQVKSDIEKITEIENPKWYILDRNSNSGYVSFIQDTHSIENISKVFPVVFFIVATLISLTSMTRMVEEQRGQIGTLKALRI